MNKKSFILDTNVILHDSNCIYSFDENDVIIPTAVLNELDGFKSGSDMKSFHTRQFIRKIDSMSEKNMFNGGISLGDNLGKIRIETSKELCPEIIDNFPSNNIDNDILNLAYYLENKKNEDIVLITKDINLRLKARALKIECEDYKSDNVDDMSRVEDIYKEINSVTNDTINKLYKKDEINLESMYYKNKFSSNECIVLNNQNKSVLARYNSKSNSIKRVKEKEAFGIKPRNTEQTFALDILLDDSIKIVSLTGRPGTGKTILSLAAALENRSNYKQIHVSRPIMGLSDKDIGYLPGNIEDKIDPYMKPIYDNLEVIKDYNKTNKSINSILDNNKMEVSALTFIRGRSLNRIFFIIDESQNLSMHEIKTIATRAGEGTKLVFTGDINQIDNPYLTPQSNGLSYLIDKMKGEDIFAHIDLKKSERSELAEISSKLL